MSLRVLIVSDRADYRQLLAHHVTLEWRDALPAEYEPATRGRLQPAFRGSVGGNSPRMSVRRLYPGVFTLARFWPTTSSPMRWASSALAADVRLSNNPDMATPAS